jgi:leucyl aminopeptidase
MKQKGRLMEFQIKYVELIQQQGPCLVVGVCPEQINTAVLQAIDEKLVGAFSMATQSQEFGAEKGDLLLLHNPQGNFYRRVLFVGLGKQDQFSLKALRQQASDIVKYLTDRKINSFQLSADSFMVPAASSKDSLQTLAEGLLMADYCYDLYMPAEKKDKRIALESVEILLAQQNAVAEAEVAVAEAEAICSGVFLARDLVNAPGNLKSPEYIARQAEALSALTGVSVKLLEQGELKLQGFEAFLAVAQGSERPPYLIVVEYKGGAQGERPYALVGKGVVFDSGGISLKPGAGMDEMKMDMAGAAAVLGTIEAAARLQLPVNLVGVIPAVENMPSGTAYRPGDIVSSLSGKTIEVLNTDAEGRLILADALTYAARYQPQAMIDLATLTGACILALGHHAAGLMGNDQALVDCLLGAGERSDERLWQLPLWDEYAEQIKSDFADVKNIGGRPGGAITAGAFLQKFAEDSAWAHIDIAGVAWAESAKAGQPKGGTGFGVRVLIDYLQAQTR